MPHRNVEALVVGAGQAGVAMSEHLGKCGINHIVLERGEIAERWRNQRWDSLVTNGPAWHDRFPNMKFANAGPDDFVHKDAVADYFANYANMINAPIECGVEVRKITRLPDERGFQVETSTGTIHSKYVVVATGPFQNPSIPSIVSDSVPVQQLHSSDYKNPEQLKQGAVLVVGAGSSGAQIADELHRSGRRVYLSIGQHERPPRTYRGRDYSWWFGVLGLWDVPHQEANTMHISIPVSGAYGGELIDFRRFAERGITILGSTQAYLNGKLSFAGDLKANIARGYESYLSLLDQADYYVKRNGIDLIEEPEARILPQITELETNPLRELSLEQAGISAIVWATGFRSDYSWIAIDTFAEDGRPRHNKGISKEQGLYFLGLPWQTRRGSNFIWGVWHDAKYIADHIAMMENYFSYPM